MNQRDIQSNIEKEMLIARETEIHTESDRERDVGSQRNRQTNNQGQATDRNTL